MIIAGAILIQDPDKQIIGDVTDKGIIDMERDIKAALYAEYPDLNGKCKYFELSTISYPQLGSANGRAVFIQGTFYYTET
jgi:hypothetical protein